MNGLDGVQPMLGQKLRAIRQARGLSLAEVSRETKISRSFLSLVEKGNNEITIGKLIRLIGFYGIHISDLLADFVGKEEHVVRRAERRSIPFPGEKMSVHLLAPDDERSMYPIWVEIEPGGCLAEKGRHPGEEFIYIVEGEVVLELEPDETITLNSGDTAWYGGEEGHSLRNPSKRPVRLISVTTPPNF
jgi:transcriptional regulator with XRE-family HTH domain